MAGHNIEVNLLFNAQTASAVSNMQQLGQLLNQIATKTQIGIDGGSLHQAVQSAQQLQIHLQNALNQDTGKLDLSKLNTSLKQSGLSLQNLMVNLQNAGPVGQQAFMRVANAIATAERTTISFGSKLSALGKTLGNTIKWQISSSAIHAAMGAVSSAVNHMKDLDRALTDISIVTEKSREDMAAFAQDAYEAANRLNTTATEYAKASLIFYQQGLSDNEAQKRADVVTKLTKVTGTATEEASSQMTAIWNNFYDGSHSLEYYADVMAKLGAETAASTDDIADGLQKFAPIAKTVGLSYETAASMIATVVDKTQQSADVVGTAFRNVFTRIQGLKLGETLEDGVDLNKYSEGLKKVGVDVLDANDKLKDLDEILPELADKWQTLDRAQKAALAQTVAGTRQYSQFMAVMENWEDIELNVEVAVDSEGTVDEQYRKWAESYEGAATRLQNIMQQFYKNFLDSDVMITFTNLLGDIVNGINGAIEAAGGFKSILLTVALLFSGKIMGMFQVGFTSLINNFVLANSHLQKTKAEMQNMVSTSIANNNLSFGEQKQLEITLMILEKKKELEAQERHASGIKKEQLALEMQLFEANAQRLQKEFERLDILRKEATQIEQQFLQQNKFSLGIAAVGYEQGKSSEVVKTAQSKSVAEIDTEITKLQSRPKKSLPDGESKQLELLRKQQNLGEELTVEEQEQLEILNKKAQELKEQNKFIEKQIQLLQEAKKLREAGIKKAIEGDVSEETATGTTEFYESSTKTETQMDFEKSDIKTAPSATPTPIEDSGIQSVQLETSIQNVEALTAASGKYTQAAQKMKAISADLTKLKGKENKSWDKAAKEMKDITVAQNKVTDVQKELNNAIKNSPKDITKYKKELAKAQKELKKVTNSSSDFTRQVNSITSSVREATSGLSLTEETSKLLDKALDDFANTPSDETLDRLNTLCSQLGISFQTTGSNLSTAAQDMANDLGIPKEKMEQLVQKLIQLGIITPEAAQKMGLLGDSMNKIPSLGERLQTIGNKVTQVAGAMMGAVQSVDMFRKAGDENASMAERVTSALMGITMAMPLLTLAFQGLSWVKSQAIKLNDKLADSEYKVEMANKKGLPKIWASVTAWIAKQIATNGWAGLILGGLLLGAIAAVVIAIGSETEAVEENTEQTKKNTQVNTEAAESQNELTKSWLDASKAMNDLTKQYKYLTEGTEDYYEAVKKLKEQAPDLIKEYEKMNDELDLGISGKIKEYKLAVQEGNLFKAQQLSSEIDSIISNAVVNNEGNQIKTFVQSAVLKLAEKSKHDDKVSVNDTYATDNTIRVDLSAGMSWKDEGQADKILKALQEGGISAWKWGEEGEDSGIAMDLSPEDVLKVNQILSELDLKYAADEELYKGVQSFLEATAEDSEKAKTASDQADTAKVVNAHRATGKDASHFANNVEEWDNYVAEVASNTGVSEDEVRNILSQEDTELSELNIRTEGLNNIEEKVKRGKENIVRDIMAGWTSENEETGNSYGYDQWLEETKQKRNDGEIDSIVTYEQWMKEQGFKAKMRAEDSVKDGSTQIQDYLKEKGYATSEINRIMTQGDLSKIEVDSKGTISTESIDDLIKSYDTKLPEGIQVTERAFKDLGKQMKKTYPALKDNDKAATQLAKNYLKLEENGSTLAQVWEDNSEALTSGTASMEDYYAAAEKMTTALNDFFGTDAFDLEFVASEEGSKLVEDAMAGSTEAIDTLQDMATDKTISEIGIDFKLDENAQSQLSEDIATLMSSPEYDNLEIGTKLSVKDDELLQKFQEWMIKYPEMAGALSDAFAEEYGSPLEYEEQTVEYQSYDKNTGMATFSVPDPESPDGVRTIQKPVESEAAAQGVTTLPILKGKDVTITKNNKLQAKTFSNLNKNKDKGGGDKKESKKPTKRRDVVERYAEINSALETQKRIMDDLSSSMDNLYGQDRIDALGEYIAALNKEIELEKQKLILNKQYIKEDKTDLENTAKKLGYGIQYNSDGNVTNKEEILESLYVKLRAAEDKYNKNKTDANSEAVDKINEQIEDFKDVLGSYEEELTNYMNSLSNITKLEIDAVAKANEKEMEALEKNTRALEKNSEKLENANTPEEYMEAANEKRELLGEDVKTTDNFIKENQTNLRMLMDKGAAEFGLTYNDDHTLANENQIKENLQKAIDSAKPNTQAWHTANEKMRQFNSLTQQMGVENQHIMELYDKNAETYEEIRQSWIDQFEWFTDHREKEIEKLEASIENTYYYDRDFETDFENQLAKNKEQQNLITNQRQANLNAQKKDWEEYKRRFGEDADYAEAMHEIAMAQMELDQELYDLQQEAREIQVSAFEDDFEQRQAKLDTQRSLLDRSNMKLLENDFVGQENYIEGQMDIVETTRINLQEKQTELENLYKNGIITDRDYNDRMMELVDEVTSNEQEFWDLQIQFKDNILAKWDYVRQETVADIDDITREIEADYIDLKDTDHERKREKQNRELELLNKKKQEIIDSNAELDRLWQDEVLKGLMSEEEWLERKRTLADEGLSIEQEIYAKQEELRQSWIDEWKKDIQDRDNLIADQQTQNKIDAAYRKDSGYADSEYAKTAFGFTALEETARTNEEERKILEQQYNNLMTDMANLKYLRDQGLMDEETYQTEYRALKNKETTMLDNILKNEETWHKNVVAMYEYWRTERKEDTGLETTLRDLEFGRLDFEANEAEKFALKEADSQQELNSLLIEEKAIQEDLLELEKLFIQGHLTQEEYETKYNALLKEQLTNQNNIQKKQEEIWKNQIAYYNWLKTERAAIQKAETTDINQLYFNVDDKDYIKRNEKLKAEQVLLEQEKDALVADKERLDALYASGAMKQEQYLDEIEKLESAALKNAQDLQKKIDEQIKLAWEEFDYQLELASKELENNKLRQEIDEMFMTEEDYSGKAGLAAARLADALTSQETARAALNALLATPLEDRDDEWLKHYSDQLNAFKESVSTMKTELGNLTKAFTDYLGGVSTAFSDASKDLDDLNGRLKTYKGLMEMSGQIEDYETINNLFAGQKKIQEEQLKMLKNQKNILIAERERLNVEMLNASGLYKDELKKKMEELEKQIEENQNSILSKIEETAQLIGEILTATMEQARKKIEETLTGSNFEEVSGKIERLNSSQEEYLTKTNQLYEVGKMIRETQLALDETDNLYAKERYRAQIAELKELENKDKMTQHDLETAQAKLEVTKAQIALEEAKNAKDSMRLVRNSSGNWDYVYTANQESINEAQNALADAENALYNVGLEGVKNYQDKIQQIEQEAIDAIDELAEKYKSGEISYEEYMERSEERMQHYMALRTLYMQEYNKALDTFVANSSTGAEDYDLYGIENFATGEAFKTMIESYASTIGSEVANALAEVSGLQGNYLDEAGNIDSFVNGVVSEQDNLISQIENDLNTDLQDLVWNLDKVAEAYADVETGISGVNDALRDQISTMVDANQLDTSIFTEDWAKNILAGTVDSNEYLTSVLGIGENETLLSEWNDLLNVDFAGKLEDFGQKLSDSIDKMTKAYTDTLNNRTEHISLPDVNTINSTQVTFTGDFNLPNVNDAYAFTDTLREIINDAITHSNLD